MNLPLQKERLVYLEDFKNLKIHFKIQEKAWVKLNNKINLNDLYFDARFHNIEHNFSGNISVGEKVKVENNFLIIVDQLVNLIIVVTFNVLKILVVEIDRNFGDHIVDRVVKLFIDIFHSKKNFDLET